jgi:hypothetical protein
VVIRDDGGDLRLLKHELGNEDSVGIASPAPREIAAVIVIPANKRATKNSKVVWRSHGLGANVQRRTLKVQRRIQS